MVQDDTPVFDESASLGYTSIVTWHQLLSGLAAQLKNKIKKYQTAIKEMSNGRSI